MFHQYKSSRIVIIGIFLILMQTLTGSSFDAITKFLSSSNFMWYHYYAIGNLFPIVISLMYLLIIGRIKKNIFFYNKKNYILPLLRGITFIPVPIIIYYILERIPISIFTPILMTTPFFIYIWSNILQKEKIILRYWIILIVGFSGTLFVAKPSFFESNPLVFIIFLIAAYNALTNVLVSKYASSATPYGFTFYNVLPLTIVCFILFILDPIYLNTREVILICLGGCFLFIAILLWTMAFQIAAKFTRVITPFFYSQLIWASFFGIIFFNESLDYLSIVGLLLIVFSGTLTILNVSKTIK